MEAHRGGPALEGAGGGAGGGANPSARGAGALSAPQP
jgi:hypothetical protein